MVNLVKSHSFGQLVNLTDLIMLRCITTMKWTVILPKAVETDDLIDFLNGPLGQDIILERCIHQSTLEFVEVLINLV